MEEVRNSRVGIKSLSSNSIKDLKAVAFLSVISDFKWLFSNIINCCMSDQPFICKCVIIVKSFCFDSCLTGSEGS